MYFKEKIMRRKLKILILALLSTLLYSSVQAQNDGSAPQTEQKQSPSGFYIGVQGSSPLFWGDLFSLGKETRLGYGGGLFAGYTIKGWLSPELSFDYGIGQLGAKEHQLDDYMDKAGIIRYLQRNASDMELGDIYSKAQYMQAGLRLQVGLLNLLRSDRYHKFDIEVAPAVYAQKFSPVLYAVSGDKKLEGYGITESDWNYAVGGDLGFRFRFSPKVSAHLRGGLLWMRNEAFEGVNNDPLWRVNLMGNASLGFTFNFGKSASRTVMSEPVVESLPVVDDSAEKTRLEEQERLAREKAVREQAEREAEARRQAELARQQAEAKRSEYIREVENLQIPALYFRRGYADIDLARNQSNLDEMMRLAKRYADTKISVEGWCDTTGTEAVNARLSQMRAETLRGYLVKNGVDAARVIKVDGKGVDHQGGYNETARRAQLKLTTDK